MLSPFKAHPRQTQFTLLKELCESCTSVLLLWRVVIHILLHLTATVLFTHLLLTDNLPRKQSLRTKTLDELAYKLCRTTEKDCQLTIMYGNRRIRKNPYKLPKVNQLVKRHFMSYLTRSFKSCLTNGKEKKAVLNLPQIKLYRFRPLLSLLKRVKIKEIPTLNLLDISTLKMAKLIILGTTID